MKFNKTITTLCLALLAVVSCTDFVQDVDDPIDLVPEENLIAEDQVPFLMDGVIGRYDITHDALMVIAEGLSDAWEFESAVVSDATFPTFGEIDEGDIPFDNNSVDIPFENLGQARFLADDLLEKVAAITFEDTDLQAEAVFTGNLYAGLTRAQYASYFGLTVTQPGGVINNSALIPRPTMYDNAVTFLLAARASAPSTYWTRVVNSLIGRIHLYQGEYADAQQYLTAGMTSGDAAFAASYSLESQNNFFNQAGGGRTQFSVDRRFGETYIAADANEANRLDIEEVSDPAELTGPAETAGETFWRSSLEGDSPLNIISWQENNLMLAELALNGVGTPGSEVALVNEVRAAYTIDPLVAVTLADLEVEREKELLHTGNRLLDQQRFGSWHLGAGTWQWFPITQSERNNNPNL